MKKSILITGWYHHGNFGDDLMGIIWGLYLKQLGYPFYIVGLKDLHKPYFDFKFGALPDNWEDAYNIVMFGGGGIYANVKISNGARDTYDFQLEEILTKAMKLNYPIYVLSAGSDKQFDADLLPAGRKLLYENAVMQTVRNLSDKELLEKQRRNTFLYFPDMLWTTPDFFKISNGEKKGKRKIAVNIELKGSKMRQSLIKAVIKSLVWLNPGTEFVFMDIWYGGYTKTETMHAPDKENCSTYVFQNITDDLTTLISCDIVITTKLHLGLVAMSYGIPVISYLGEDKTKLLFNSLNLTEFCIDIKNSWKIPYLINKSNKMDLYKKFLQSDKIQSLKKAAYGHFESLKNVLENR